MQYEPPPSHVVQRAATLQQLSFLEDLDVAPPPQWGHSRFPEKEVWFFQGVSKLSCIKNVYVGVPDWK